VSETTKEITLQQSQAAGFDQLTDREKYAYGMMVKMKYHELPQEAADRYYTLFESGKSCEEIRKIDPSVSLAQIVHSRVRDGWDVKKEEHRTHLETEIPQRVEITKLESLDFLSKTLFVLHKKFGKALDRYIATGDGKELEGTPFEKVTMHGYQNILTIFLAATGAGPEGGTKTVNVQGNMTVNQTQNSIVPSPEEAARILDVLVEESSGKKK
jgi:hypothetical protein